jgi:hyperosmotically inducible protein
MKRTFYSIAGAAALTFALAATPALAEDADLQAKVEARLAKSKLIQQGEIRVSADGGAVTLEGAVTTVAARRAAEKAALKEAKVVENRLRVVPEARPDKDIVKDVRSEILRYPFYTIFDSVSLSVNDGVVTLSGSVLRPNRKSEIESSIADVRGVRDIKNEITVQPVSIFDDRLRLELARKIYGSEDFVQYGNQVNPPIHILVDHGHITLTGYVASAVDRALVDAIARQTLAFEVVNRLKVDGEKPEDTPQQVQPAGIEI